jgi:hypothetical protein
LFGPIFNGGQYIGFVSSGQVVNSVFRQIRYLALLFGYVKAATTKAL